MPTKPYTLPQRVDRFRDQRWLIDKGIDAVGPEFDQSRLQHYSAPVSRDHRGPVMGLDATIPAGTTSRPDSHGSHAATRCKRGRS